ncbi:MAG: hypothetical protein QM598_05635 [Protaetiibacter sp.]
MTSTDTGNRIHDGEAPMFTAHAYSTSRHGDTYNVEFIDGGTLYGEQAGIEVSAGWSTLDEDVKLIMIDTTEGTGHIRIRLNDGVIYDADPEAPADELPALLDAARGALRSYQDNEDAYHALPEAEQGGSNYEHYEDSILGNVHELANALTALAAYHDR